MYRNLYTFYVVGEKSLGEIFERTIFAKLKRIDLNSDNIREQKSVKIISTMNYENMSMHSRKFIYSYKFSFLFCTIVKLRENFWKTGNKSQ